MNGNKPETKVSGDSFDWRGALYFLAGFVTAIASIFWLVPPIAGPFIEFLMRR